MEDFTPRMAALMGQMRRQMNGQLSESLQNALPAAERYGLNFGVSLPALRQIARGVGHDHPFARFLYRQDVRELRLAALWIADPEQVTSEELPFWIARSMPAEQIEEAAFALLSRVPACGVDPAAGGGVVGALAAWLTDPEPARRYAAALALARRDDAPATLPDALLAALEAYPGDTRFAMGAAALLTRLAVREPDLVRAFVQNLEGPLSATPAGRILRDEMAWRLDG